MRPRLNQSVSRSEIARPTLWMLLCALSCGNLAMAAETADPFSTMGKYTAKPAFSSDVPCSDAMPSFALDLTSIVNIALCNNPQTREVWANSRAQAAQVGVTQASYLPTLNASLAESQATPGVRQRNLSLNLSYLLYDFGARAANLESARQLLISVNATQNNTVQSLFLAAVQAYYQSRATEAAFAAAEASERAAQESFKAANARYLAGSAISADKFTAQTAYSQATLNRITAHGAMKIAQGTLANLLGLDANLTILLVADTQSDETNIDKNMQDFEQNVALLIEAARRHRPDLLAAEATVKAAEATAEAARAAGKPSISMTAATNQTNTGGINSQGSSLGISMSVPLFSGYAPTYRIRAAEAQVETKKAQLERIRLQIALDVWTAYQNLLTATQNRRSSADLLSSAAQAERVAVGRFKAGSGIMLDLLNAQNTLASARQQRIQADLNWNISRATLAQTMGNLDAALLSSLALTETGNTPKP